MKIGEIRRMKINEGGFIFLFLQKRTDITI